MDFEKYQKQAEAELLKITEEEQLKNWKTKYLGRKSELSQYLKTWQLFHQKKEENKDH